jgi:hypothetical protein
MLGKLLRYFFLLVLLIVSGCIGDSRVNTETLRFERGEATSVEVDLDLSTGNFTLDGSSTMLFEGEMKYQTSDYEPHAEYRVDDGEGRLTLEQLSNAADSENGDHYVTSVQLNKDIPLSLQIVKEEGHSEMALNDLTLLDFMACLGLSLDRCRNLVDPEVEIKDTALEDSSPSNSDIQMVGSYPELTEMAVLSALGERRITVDGDFDALELLMIELGVKDDRFVDEGDGATRENQDLETQDINMDGSDIVAISGRFPEILTISVMTDGGNDTISLSGDVANATAINLSVGAGDDVIDLTGEWLHDATITVISDGGSVSIQLPSDIGARIEVVNRSAQVVAEGFNQEENLYTNDVYGQSSVTLNILLTVKQVNVPNQFNLITVDGE